VIVVKFITLRWLKKKRVPNHVVKVFKKKFGRKATIKQIVDYLHKINRPDLEGWLMAQELEITIAMIANGADIHADDDSALRRAVEKACLDLTKFLIEKGADIHALSDYALRRAVKNGYFDMVKLLLEKGADIHAYCDYPLKRAVKNGYFDMVKLLLEKGADIHALSYYDLHPPLIHPYTEELLKQYKEK
jgi:hypothetical protein